MEWNHPLCVFFLYFYINEYIYFLFYFTTLCSLVTLRRDRIFTVDVHSSYCRGWYNQSICLNICWPFGSLSHFSQSEIKMTFFSVILIISCFKIRSVTSNSICNLSVNWIWYFQDEASQWVHFRWRNLCNCVFKYKPSWPTLEDSICDFYFLSQEKGSVLTVCNHNTCFSLTTETTETLLLVLLDCKWSLVTTMSSDNISIHSHGHHA